MDRDVVVDGLDQQQTAWWPFATKQRYQPAALAQDLKPQGVSVAILQPGKVGTEMIGGHGDITPEEAAERLAQRIDALTLSNSGTFWHSNGDVLPW